MARPASSRQEPSQLLTFAYLSVLTIVFLGVGALIWWWRSTPDSTPSSSSFTATVDDDSYDSPTDIKPHKGVRQALLDQMTPEQSASRVIRGQLDDLQRYIRNQANGKPSVRPAWIDRTFVGVGIDPEKFTVKLKDSVTEVQRYTRSETAPKFSGNRAFQQFVANTLATIFDCEDFRIDIRLEKLTRNDGQFTATLLAEAVGSREQNKDEWNDSGARKKVLQTSSIWQTTWTKLGTNQYQLLTAQVPATEVVKLSLNTPRLFFDCTDSILGNSGCLKEQLIFGVDQWASKLPGVDTQGNSGLSIGDINDDGLDDIYLCQPQGIPNRLLIQKRDGSVVDESKNYGVNLLDESRASLLVDLDNDGDQDLIVATKSELVIMSNSGAGRFEIINKLDRCCDGLSLSAADYDNDGDVDLFLCREPKIPPAFDIAEPSTNLLAGSVLLRNEESFKFVDATASTGLVQETALSARSAIWFDRDLDGDQDLYVTAGESGGIQFVNTDGFFKKASGMTASSLPDQQSASTGDFNGDGRFDLLVASESSFGAKSHSQSHVSFGGQEDSARPYFLRAPLFNNQYANTSLVADLNNDGRDDLVIGNGGFTRVALEDLSWLFPQPIDEAAKESDRSKQLFDAAKLEQYSIHSRQRNRCYASIGTSGFAEVSAVSGLNYPEDTRAMAATDWDHDGDVDVLVLNRTGPQLRVFINVLNRRNSVSFRLTGEASNRDAIGARVELKLKGVPAPLIRTVQAGGGFLSQSSKRLTFGVGESKKVESVTVHWPSGKVHHFKTVTIGSMYELAEGNLEPVEKVNDRYRLKIRGSRLLGSIRQPTPDERTLFVPRFPMPSLEAQVADGKWNQLKASSNRPTIFLFWGQNSQSEQALERLNRFVTELEEANADVVSVFTDSSNLKTDEQWKYLVNFAENSPAIKNWASLSTGGLEKLKVVFGHWFKKREFPEHAFALMVDSNQQVIGIYPVDAFRKKQLLEDLRLSDQSPELANQNSNDDGFWATSFLNVNSLELVDSLEKAGFEDASKQFLTSTSRETAELFKNQAKDYAAVGRPDISQQYFKAALSKDPNNISALIGLSNLAIDQALAASIADRDRTSTDKTVPAVSDSGLTLPEALAGFEKVLKIDPNEWRAIIGIAKIQLLQDRPNEALKSLVQYQKTNPQVEVLAMQGRVLFQLGNYNEALRVLGRAYDERPNLAYLAGDLGYLYLLNDEAKYARKLLRHAHRLQPSDPTFLRMLAETEFLTGNLNRAVELFTKVNQIDPGQPRSKNVLAWLLATCPYEDQRDGVAALALIAPESESLTDQSAATLEIYAACYAEVGEFDKAIQFQQQAVDKTNNDLTPQHYSQSQLKGMLSRLELYRTRQPCRTANTLQTPIQANGSTLTDGGFQALRL